MSLMHREGCPPAHNGCMCSCHRIPGIMHIAACCGPGPGEARLTAEDLRDQSLVAADAYVKACGVAAEELARAILPLVKRAEDEGLDKHLAAGALVSMFRTFDDGTAIVEAAMNKVAKEMGIEI